MTLHVTESIWLNETEECSLEQLAETSGLSIEELRDFIDIGVIEPIRYDKQHYLFQMHYIVIARTARRLRDDFELDTSGIAVALRLLRQIHELEQQLNSMQARPLL